MTYDEVMRGLDEHFRSTAEVAVRIEYDGDLRALRRVLDELSAGPHVHKVRGSASPGGISKYRLRGGASGRS